MKFADKIRQLRQEQHLTQAQVAEAAGITRRNYISYEKDGRYPRNRQIYYRLADLFGCDVNYLLTEDELFIDRASEEYGSRGRRQAEILVKQLSGLFAGGELSDHDRDAVMIACRRLISIVKRITSSLRRRNTSHLLMMILLRRNRFSAVLLCTQRRVSIGFQNDL